MARGVVIGTYYRTQKLAKMGAHKKRKKGNYVIFKLKRGYLLVNVKQLKSF